MSAYPPPSSNLPIFNPNDFDFENFPLTIADAANFFLSYPTAQGTETLLTTIVNGSSTFNDISTHNDLVEISQPTAALNALNIENDNPGQSITATSFTPSITAGILTAQGSAVVNETNPIVEAGDSVISSSIFGADDTGSLTLTQKSSATGSGIRLNDNMVKIYGDLDLQTGSEINFPDGSIQNTAYVSPATETLAQTLLQGNSAGATDIDMNSQNITNATAITTGTLNYTTLNPPVSTATETLAQTLVAGNSAGAISLDMNNQDIQNAGTIFYTALNPPVGGAETLAQTLVLGNSAGATDIDMNTQNITNATSITTGTLNYTTLNPPVVPAPSNAMLYPQKWTGSNGNQFLQANLNGSSQTATIELPYMISTTSPPIGSFATTLTLEITYQITYAANQFNWVSSYAYPELVYNGYWLGNIFIQPAAHYLIPPTPQPQVITTYTNIGTMFSPVAITNSSGDCARTITPITIDYNSQSAFNKLDIVFGDCAVALTGTNNVGLTSFNRSVRIVDSIAIDPITGSAVVSEITSPNTNNATNPIGAYFTP